MPSTARSAEPWSERDDKLLELMTELRYPQHEIDEALERSTAACRTRYNILKERRKERRDREANL